MATTAKIAKELKSPNKIRLRNRCKLCGRPRGFMRKFTCAGSASAGSRLKATSQA